MKYTTITVKKETRNTLLLIKIRQQHKTLEDTIRYLIRLTKNEKKR